MILSFCLFIALTVKIYMMIIFKIDIISINVEMFMIMNIMGEPVSASVESLGTIFTDTLVVTSIKPSLACSVGLGFVHAHICVKTEENHVVTLEGLVHISSLFKYLRKQHRLKNVKTFASLEPKFICHD